MVYDDARDCLPWVYYGYFVFCSLVHSIRLYLVECMTKLIPQKPKQTHVGFKLEFGFKKSCKLHSRGHLLSSTCLGLLPRPCLFQSISPFWKSSPFEDTSQDEKQEILDVLWESYECKVLIRFVECDLERNVGFWDLSITPCIYKLKIMIKIWRILWKEMNIYLQTQPNFT